MTGPRATDILANERTFLAYLRTALSFIAFGFVVARFALFTREIAVVLHTVPATQSQATVFGTAVTLFGSLVAVYGGYRYVVTDRGLRSDHAVSLSPLIATVGAAVVTIIGCVVGISLVASVR